MVLIYSKAVDDFVNKVIDHLDDDFVRLGNRDKIEIKRISVDGNLNFVVDGEYFTSIDLNEIKAVWFNGGGVFGGSSSYESKCYQTLIDSISTQLEVTNIGRICSDFEVNKLHATIEAQKQGLIVPETLITENKEDLQKFFNRHIKEGIVCKRINDEHYYTFEEYTFNFGSTFIVDSDLLKKIPDCFAISLFQKRLKPDFEVRAIYVRGKFYAVSIHVFNDETDYRTNFKSPGNIRIIPFDLPKIIEVKLKSVFQNLNLNYGSADLIYYQDEFYFLEINPAGQIGFVNEACNFYIEERISQILNS